MLKVQELKCIFPKKFGTPPMFSAFLILIFIFSISSLTKKLKLIGFQLGSNNLK
jgi:hypothetical protein